MTMTISFDYKGKNYEFEVSDDMVDMTHYDVVWDYWFYENDNLINYYDIKDEEEELVFEITADKVFFNGKDLIGDNNIYINVYENVNADDYIDQIRKENIETKFS